MTHLVDLKELLARESERVEWKENVADIDDVVRAICAFSNDYSNLGGGYVVCGAAEGRDEHGFQKVILSGLTSSRLKEVEGQVMAKCRQLVEPAVTPLVQELEGTEPSRRALIFLVPATRHAHSFRRPGEGSPSYPVRVGRETIHARNGVLRELLVRKSALEPWDKRAAPGATVDDLDLLALRVYLQRMKLWDDELGMEYFLSDSNSISPFVPPFMEREGLTGTLHRHRVRHRTGAIAKEAADQGH